MKNVKLRKLLSKMTMFDDSLMSVCFDDNIPLATLVLRIILGRSDIIVTEVKSQYSISTIKNKNCRLDVKMTDVKGNIYDVEIQNKNEGALPQRARYYSSILDSKALKTGEDTDNLVETYVIFITKTDYYKRGAPLYIIDRYINVSNGEYEKFNDGSHIIYVNGSYRGDDSIGYLMRDFNEYELSKIHFKEVRDIIQLTKNELELGGRNGMSELWENALKEEREEGREEGMQELLRVVKEYKLGNISEVDAAKRLNITLEDFSIISK